MIDRFRGDYAFLSNMYPSPITVAGIDFPTVEHAYQAAKVRLDHPARHGAQLLIAQQRTPAAAKREGGKLALRADWEPVRLLIMQRLIALKFAEPGDLATRLVATDPHELVERNSWGDAYWGIYKGVGCNWLGKLLMDQRDILIGRIAP